MNLLSTFPEIEVFFQNEKFTENELSNFLSEIEKKYEDKELRKSASTLIKLKLIQFDTFSENKTEKKNIVQVVKKSNQNKQIVDKTHFLTEELKFKSIESIANTLEWSLSLILKLLEQKGICKKQDEILEEKEFKIVKDMFDARLLGLERIHKSNQPINRINNKPKNKSINNKNNNDVYNRIESIGLGKVIYIRKK